MAYIQYKDINFNTRNRLLINKINEKIEDLAKEGYTPTLRQLYYSLVSKNIIPNEEKSYKSLTRIQ